MRRLPFLTAAALALIGSVGPSSAQATADQPCTAIASPVPRWGLSPSTDSSPTRDGTGHRLVGDCTEDQQYFTLWWQASGAGGVSEAHIVFETEYCGNPLLREAGLRFRTPPPVGMLKFTGTGTSQCDGSDILTNSPTIDVRAKSWGYVAASRSGGKVHLTVRALRYWTSTQANGNWMGASGVIQYRDAGSSTWRSLKNVSTDSAGRDSYVYTTTARRSYRVLFPNATFIWGSVSEPTSTT